MLMQMSACYFVVCQRTVHEPIKIVVAIVLGHVDRTQIKAAIMREPDLPSPSPLIVRRPHDDASIRVCFHVLADLP